MHSHDFGIVPLSFGGLLFSVLLGGREKEEEKRLVEDGDEKDLGRRLVWLFC